MESRQRLFELLAEARNDGKFDEALRLMEDLYDDSVTESDDYINFGETTAELEKILARELGQNSDGFPK